MTEEQIKQLAEKALTTLTPEERFPLLLTVAQLVYPENEGYIALYKELRQFIREASQNLLEEGFGDVVVEQDDLDLSTALAALAEKAE